MASTPSHVQLTKATQVRLRDAGVTESWLEDVIEEDSIILGLGESCLVIPVGKMARWLPISAPKGALTLPETRPSLG